MRPTDEQLAAIGFVKITDINPQPSGRASFAYRGPRNVIIHVWETGFPELDGALVFEYCGGNIVPVRLDWLEKLGQLVDLGHRLNREDWIRYKAGKKPPRYKAATTSDNQKTEDWFLDCFLETDEKFPANTYYHKELKPLMDAAAEVLSREESGIKAVKISKTTLGQAPMALDLGATED